MTDMRQSTNANTNSFLDNGQFSNYIIHSNRYSPSNCTDNTFETSHLQTFAYSKIKKKGKEKENSLGIDFSPGLFKCPT